MNLRSIHPETRESEAAAPTPASFFPQSGFRFPVFF